MTDVRRPSGHRAAKSRHRAVKNHAHTVKIRPLAVRSGMSVCLALAVIYSFGYPGATPLTSGAHVTGSVSSGADVSGSIIAQATKVTANADVPHTGHVGEQMLEQPSAVSPFGEADSLVPGRSIPVPVGGSLVAGEINAATSQILSTMERPGKGMLISPLQFLAPSSPFGPRISPITGEHGEFHSGQDFAAPCGTPVFSADAGVVRAAGWHPWGGGNRVEVDHGNGLVTTYNHLEGIAVKTGERVGAGQVIATIGTTGASTGCHLHFETILNGEHTNPEEWKLIPLDSSGPVEMPALENFGPGTGNGSDGDIAWVAYLVPSEALHPVAVQSPARVDAQVPAAGAHLTTGTPPAATKKLVSASTKQSSSTTAAAPASPSGTQSIKASPSPKPSVPGTSASAPTTKPAPSVPGTAASTPTTKPAPPSSVTGPTQPPAVTDPKPAPVVTDPVVTDPEPAPVVTDPVVTDPKPAPVVTDPVVSHPEPAPVVTDPEPVPVVTDPVVTDPEPAPVVTDPEPAAEPEAPAPAAAEACETADSAAGIDPVTGELIVAEEPCVPTSGSDAAATGTDPAREPASALIP